MKYFLTTLYRTFSKPLTWFLGIVLLFLIPLNLFFAHFEPEDPFLDNNGIVLCIILASYGFSRVLRFHPVFNKGYFSQLTLSPWNTDKKLLRGPVHLFWADAVIIAVFMLLTVTMPVQNIWIIPLTFLVAYNIGLLLSFCITDQFEYIGIYILLAPLTVYPHLNLTITLIVIAMLTAIGSWGVRDYFKKFPWNTSWWKSDFIETLKKKAIQQCIIQWPFSELSIAKPTALGVGGAFMIAVIFGWWAHVINWIVMKESGEPIGLLLWVSIVILSPSFRTLRYICKYRPPISIIGRIRTGRLIIPGYDKVFIPHIATLLVTALIVFGGLKTNMPEHLIMECAATVAIFLSIALPPSLEKWHYTGQHRMLKTSAKPMVTTKNKTNSPSLAAMIQNRK